MLPPSETSRKPQNKKTASIARAAHNKFHSIMSWVAADGVKERAQGHQETDCPQLHGAIQKYSKTLSFCVRVRKCYTIGTKDRERWKKEKKRHYFQTYLLRNIIEIQGRTSPLANSNKKLGMIDSLSFFLCGRLCHRSDSSNREKNKGTHTRTHTHTKKGEKILYYGINETQSITNRLALVITVVCGLNIKAFGAI